MIFDVLAEPNRRHILELLRTGERPVGDLVEALAISQPAVSKHLRVLREAGLVEARVEAQRRLYSLRPEPLRDVDTWLEPYRLLWSSRLDDLARHLDAMSDDPSAGSEEPKGAKKRKRSKKARNADKAKNTKPKNTDKATKPTKHAPSRRRTDA